jgi:hypothetical protein
MGILSAIQALFSSKKAGEHIVKSAEAAYHNHRRKYPDKDPHYHLALAYLAYYQAIGANAYDPTLQMTAFQNTYEFACLPHPQCGRALGIDTLRRSYVEWFMQARELQYEFMRLMAPVRTAKKEGTLEELYRTNNPNMPSRPADWGVS